MLTLLLILITLILTKFVNFKQIKSRSFHLIFKAFLLNFLELSELVNEFTSCPHVICLQKTWKVIDNAMFPLVNYHNLETNTRSVACGGGVGIYVKQNLSSEAVL